MTRTPDTNFPSPTVVQEPHFRPYPPPRPRFPIVPFLLFAAVFLAIGAGAFAWYTHIRPIDPTAEAERLRLQRQRLEMQEAASRQQEKVALARASCQTILEKGQRVLSLVPDFDNELKLWRENVASLLTDDRGRGLAANPSYVLVFRKLYDQPHPTKDQADAIRRRIELILDPIRKALGEEATLYVPSEEATASLETQNKALLALIQQYHEPRLQLEALVTQAGSAPPSAATLQSALQQLAAKEADEQAKTIAAAEDIARKKADQDLATARADKIRQAAQNTADQIREDQKLEKAQADSKRKETAASREAEVSRGESEAKKTREAGEKDRKAKLAESEEVKSLLAPFITPGYWQPGVPAGQSTTKQPVSLSNLSSFGALQETPGGLQRLLGCGTHFYGQPQSPDTMRPRWPWSAAVDQLKPEDLEQLKLAQKYLRELGSTLVEQGKLSP